jgi:regulator of cell morphogenesis and NO signaling
MARPDGHSTIREWLAFRPGLSREFTKYGVDLCRDADTSLAELCRGRGLDPLLVKAELDHRSGITHGEVGADWAAAPLTELCQHLERVHHAFYRREFPRLAALLEKVKMAYSTSHPYTQELESVFQRFRALLEAHLEREESELFPAIAKLMELTPSAVPHSLAGLVNSLEQEHDAIDAEFLRIRELTHGFVAPREACQTFQSLLDGLWELEMNLHQNVYEENRFLFPRALRHEAALAATVHPDSGY